MMRGSPRCKALRAWWASRALTATLAVVALWGSAAAQPADWPHPAELSFEPIAFEAPSPRREVLSNGLVVHLAEDRTLPLVRGVAYVKAPGLYDPPEKVGLASFTADLLREGGAGGRAPEEIDEALEFLGASVEAQSGDVLASVSFSSLEENVDEVLPIWRDVLVAPDFAPERIEVQRQRQLESIRRIEDQPVQVALREFRRRVAEGHPAGDFPSEETVRAITREDLRAFHDDHYAPSSTVLAVTGDFDADEMLERLERLLGSWEADRAAPPELPPFDDTPGPRLILADKDVQQSVIIVGQPAMRAYQPPYTAFSAANHVLGAGGFSSRLFQEIRTRRGLAYATGSQLGQGFDVPGIFLAYAITRVDATGQVLELLLEEIRTLVEEGVTADELEQSVRTLVNQSLFRDTSVAELTQRTARVELLGLDPGYFEEHLERLQELTPDEVHEAAREVLDPDALVIMVVGDAESFDVPLSSFGEVEQVDLE